MGRKWSSRSSLLWQPGSQCLHQRWQVATSVGTRTDSRWYGPRCTPSSLPFRRPRPGTFLFLPWGRVVYKVVDCRLATVLTWCPHGKMVVIGCCGYSTLWSGCSVTYKHSGHTMALMLFWQQRTADDTSRLYSLICLFFCLDDNIVSNLFHFNTTTWN